MRIVSVTPLPVERDSRTFKMAASFARKGYDSVVVEDVASSPGERPFTLIAARPAPAVAVTSSAEEAPTAPVSVPPAGDTDVEADAYVPTTDTLLGRLAVTFRFLPPSVRGPLGRAAEGVWRLIAQPMTLLAGLKGLADFSRLAYRRLPEADAYYLHSYLQFPAVYAKARQVGAPVIYDAHDLYSVLHRDGRVRTLTNRILWRTYALLERLCVRSAADCVTVSDGVAQLQRARFGRAFHVVRNAHDRRLDDPSAPSMREALGLDDAFLLVVVGNAKPGGMAVESAVRALTLLPADVHLVLLGGNYEPYGELARELGIGSRVHTPGSVQPTDVAAAISTADLAPILYWGATPNLENCLPNGLFHVLAGGIPVLYPELNEITRLVSPLGCGMPIEPRAPESIAHAVTEFRRDAELRVHLTSAARAAASEVLWEREEPELFEVVSGVVSR